MAQRIQEAVNQCELCQRYKWEIRPHGKLPPKEVQHMNPWDEVGVDLIGPWTIKAIGNEYIFRALTCTDSVINITEVIPIPNATAEAVARSFEDEWLSQYPKPMRCVHDNGNKFLGI